MEQNESTSFNKFQWSCFVDSSRIEQFVVRTNDEVELLAGIQFVRDLLPDTQKPAQNGHQPTEPEPAIPSDVCAIHNARMKPRQGKNGNSWYDHRFQIEGVWQICNGQTIRASNPVTQNGATHES